MLKTSQQGIPLIRLSTMRLVLKQCKNQQLMVESMLLESGCPEVLSEQNLATYMPEICWLRFMDKLFTQLDKAQLSTFLLGLTSSLSGVLLDKRYQQCSDIKQALILLAEQMHSYSNFSEVTLIEKAGDTWITVSKPTNKNDNHWLETLTLLFIIQFLRKLTSSKWLPTKIQLSNENIDALASFISFTTIQVYFAQPQLAINLGCSLLSSPIQTRALTKSYNDDTQLPVLSFSQNVQQALAPYIGCNNCLMDEFSGIVGMHKRQLQRLLKEQGTSFKQIKEQLSIDLGITLIQHKRFSMADIAVHLGYMSSSQFARAMKRVTGKTPSQFR